MRILPYIALLLGLLPTVGFGQSAVLQGGPVTQGHVPMYLGQFQQPVIQDSGPASGGGLGVGLNELLLTVRGIGTPPFANAGSGPFGTNLCNYDAPVTNLTGYHYMCFSPNAQGGGLIAYGAGGTATALPLYIEVNGTKLNIQNIGGSLGNVVVSTSGNPTVLSTTFMEVINNSFPAITTVYLPATPATNQYACIKDGAGNAQSYPITINGNGNLIDGQSTIILRQNYGSMNFAYDGTSWRQW